MIMEVYTFKIFCVVWLVRLIAKNLQRKGCKNMKKYL